MRLAEMLSYADIDQLHQLASTYACDCNINSKNELIQSLLTSIKRNSIIDEQLDMLRQEEFHFLMHIVFDARTMFSLEDLRAKAKFSYLQDLDRDTYRKLISIALKKGWIFRGISRHAGSSFQVPDDMRTLWATAILRKELGNRPIFPDPTFYRDEGDAIIQDVRAFLRYVERHHPSLTSEGVIYRRSQQQILEIMAVAEELVEKGGWRFGYGRHFRDYPDRFSLIYDFCFYRGYIREEASRELMLTPQAEEASQLPAEILAMEMVKFWLRLYKRPVSGLAMLTRMISRAAEQWVDEETLLSMTVRRVRAYYYDEPDNIAKNRILKMMVHLGLLAYGRLDADTWGYQTTAFGKSMLEAIEGSAMKEIVLERKPNPDQGKERGS